MIEIELPNDGSTCFRLTADLDGIERTLKFTWCRSLDCWYLDLLTRSGEPIALGLLLSSGVRLLEGCQGLNRPSGELLFDRSDSVSGLASLSDLGSVGRLYYLTREEVSS